MFKNFFFLENSTVNGMWKLWQSRQATDGDKAHALCILDT